MERCGNCTMCCKLPAVPVLDKPYGQWCKHCAAGVGCKIYEKRPEPCRSYQCMYLMNERLPDELRPDRCHVVIEPALPGTKTMYALVDEHRPDAWQTRRVRDLIAAIVRRGYAVVVRCGNKTPATFLPSDMTPEQMGADIDVSEMLNCTTTSKEL